MPDFQDLRLLHGSTRRLTSSNAPHQPFTGAGGHRHQRRERPQNSAGWIIKLPQPPLPVTRLSCATRNPVPGRKQPFTRKSSTNAVKNIGTIWRRHLGAKARSQEPGIFPGSRRPVKRHVVLETHKWRQTQPIALEKYILLSRNGVLFKAGSDDELFLYYGNPRVTTPNYDLSLVAGQLCRRTRPSPRPTPSNNS